MCVNWNKQNQCMTMNSRKLVNTHITFSQPPPYLIGCTENVSFLMTKPHSRTLLGTRYSTRLGQDTIPHTLYHHSITKLTCSGTGALTQPVVPGQLVRDTPNTYLDLETGSGRIPNALPIFLFIYLSIGLLNLQRKYQKLIRIQRIEI